MGPSNEPTTRHLISSSVKHYNLVYTRKFLSVERGNKSVVAVNGQFPGPTIRVPQGEALSKHQGPAEIPLHSGPFVLIRLPSLAP